MKPMRPDDEREPVEPFGQPDGAFAEPSNLEDDFVSFPSHFGGIARPASDARVRVVAGRLGAGKSLYLRRMQLHQLEENDAVFAEKPTRNLADISSEDIVKLIETLGAKSENTETLKRLWRAAIFRSAASFLLTEPLYLDDVNDEYAVRLKAYEGLLGTPESKRRVTHEARLIMQDHRDKGSLRRYLNHPSWTDLEALILEILAQSRPLFLYIDAIDDNFKYAPAHWLRCQRGLFYAVMDLIRDSESAARLHVVIALRDIALASTRASDAGTRYFEETHVNVLTWNNRSIKTLLRHKVERLPDAYFLDPRNKTIASWLGVSKVLNRREARYEEGVEDYILRHTRLVPRDVVILGNRLCRAILHFRSDPSGMSIADVVRDEVARSARSFIGNQLAQVANQLWSDMMPLSAGSQNYETVYTQPNPYQINSAVDAVIDAMASTATETFGVTELEEMNNSISSAVQTQVSLGDILWQNQLLGMVERKRHHEVAGVYYSLDDFARTTLPRADEYVWNPLVFDVTSRIEASLEKPLPPTG